VATNPDFLAGRVGVSPFYLEVTLAMPPGDAAAGRRLAALHDTLDRMDSPDYFLEFEYRGNAVDNIHGRELRERLVDLSQSSPRNARSEPVCNRVASIRNDASFQDR
jgi:hypothetical protein